MTLSTSFLMIQDDQEKIEQLDKYTDYMHYDIMDGIFTDKTTLDYQDLLKKTKNVRKPKDVHLMVQDVKKYTDLFCKIKSDYITFHFEAVNKPLEMIDYIKSKNVKVGMAINPKTGIQKIIKYLNKLDLVLVMSVEAGAGGQSFIDISDKITFLANYRDTNNLSYIMEVDGGIKPEIIDKVKSADMIVVGSYITNGNIEKQIKKIRRFI